MAIVKSSTSKSFRTTLRYASEKSTALLFTNVPEALGDPDIDEIASSMEIQAASNSRCEKPCYHISISPSRDQPIKREDWFDLIDNFLELTGFEKNQAIAYLHEDTTYSNGKPRPHAHLIVNRIKDDGIAIDTSWDWYRFQSAMHILEKQLGWQSTPYSWEMDRRSDPSSFVQRYRKELAKYERGDRDQPPKPSKRSQFANAVEQAIEQAIDAQNPTLQGVEHYLASQGIEVIRSREHVGWAFKDNEDFYFSGSQLGRKFSLPAVNKILKARSRQKQKPQAEHLPALNNQHNLAKVLTNYAKSRAKVYGGKYTDPIESTLGTVKVQADRVLISNKFEALKNQNSWVVKKDELTERDKKWIASMPQTPESYVKQNRGKKILQTLKSLAPHEFNGSKGAIRWLDKNQKIDCKFHINRNSQLDVQISGFDTTSHNPIFRGTIANNGAILIHRCEIPSTAVSDLIEYADQARSPKPQHQRELTPCKSTGTGITELEL